MYIPSLKNTLLLKNAKAITIVTLKIIDNHNKYKDNENIWNVPKIVKVWQSQQILLKKMQLTDLLNAELPFCFKWHLEESEKTSPWNERKYPHDQYLIRALFLDYISIHYNLIMKQVTQFFKCVKSLNISPKSTRKWTINTWRDIEHHQSFRSVAQSCPTLCNPMNRSMPGLPVHHQLLEFTQTHVHWVSDAIQPSHPLSSPSPPACTLSQHKGLF